MKIGLIDCDDSYTLNIADYLRQCHANVEVINHADTSVESLIEKDFNAIVLSPGPKSPAGVPLLFDLIRYFETRIPILGICLGHQAIGLHYGMKIVHSEFPIHGSPVEIEFAEDPIFKNIEKPFFGMRYNSLTMRSEDISPLEVTCRDIHGEIMGFKHKSFPIYSFQFHPESIGTPQGLTLFQNWINLIS